MRALVTGGAGFIGAHLSERLSSRGHRVIAVDDLSTGRAANLAHLVGGAGVEFVTGSVLDAGLMADLTGRVDAVFHLAAAVGVRRIVDDPLRGLHTNLRGTEVVLDAACHRGIPVVLASTSEVYGKNTADALDEDAPRVLGSPLIGRWSYAEAKAVDETLAYSYWRQRGLPAVIVRPFNIVGPGQTGRYGMVVPRLVDQALRGEPLTVYGDGAQTRCFCHVAEAVDAFVTLAQHPGAYGRVFNIGRPEEVSIRSLAQRVVELTGSSSPIRYVPYEVAYPEGFEDMARRVPDISRVRELIGFQPRMGLDQILRSVIEDQSAALSRPAGPREPGQSTVPPGALGGDPVTAGEGGES